jgi:hypothetical protein
MKASARIQNKPIIPSRFHIAPRIEDFASATISESAPPLSETPFADLMLHPEKLEAALKRAKSENDAFDAARTCGKSPVKRATRSAKSKNRDDGGGGISSSHSLVDLKPTGFHLDQFPLDMFKSEDGVWYTIVPLPPGNYSYRFIVDGEWCDDPSSVLHLHDNPPGRANAVVEVI